ncbi:MAG: baseplate J/gp47 family protein, partial [Candidatus Limnocylindrales bacterium]
LGLIGAFFLPSASITITPRPEAVGPLQLSIRADPTAASPDPVAGVVPAIQLRKDFAAVNTFKATGKKTNTTPATGMVTFTSINTVTSVSFPAGSIVSTTSGVAFTTTEALTIPRARFGHTAPSGSVAVQAVKGGTAGNVAADSINQLPAGYASYLYTVDNPAATTGGTATTTLQVQKSDTDAAVASLTKTLKQQFNSWLNQPDGLPAGSTAYPKTGALSAPTADTDPGTLVGVVEASFELTLTATGTETAADPATVSSLALGRIQAQVSPDFSLVAGSERVILGPAQADGQTLVFPVTAMASQVRHLDPDTLRQQVAGKSIDEARSILSGYGSVDIQTWPGFVGSIPSLAWRLSLTIDTSAAGGLPGASLPPAGASIVPGSSPSAGPSGPPSSGPSAVPSSGPADQSANP